MKIHVGQILTLLSSRSVVGVHQSADIYYHNKQPLGPSMWHFSGDGLTIYSVDGKKTLKQHRKKSLCKPYESWRGGVTEDCYFFTVASDGHKYVWAATLAGQHRVEAFDIDTGDYAGYNPTCNTPLDLKYHPSRQEMWVRCAQENFAGGHEGEIDVFSSNSLSADLEHVYLNDTRRPYGRINIHSSMGTYGYVTAYDQPYLSEIDLSSKQVEGTFPLPDGAIGAYDTTYSPVNGHVYARARVCCSCGFEGADVEECGRYARTVNVTTGPSAGMMDVNGTCGAGCEGTVADTIGVFEFDTVERVFVGKHNIKRGTGFGADPVSSPDGNYVMLLPNDGGMNVRILKPGESGAASAIVRDIPTNFEGGTPGKTVVSDFAFVQDDNRNILVLGASTDNDVVLVDLNNYKTRKLNLLRNSTAESTGGSTRKLEWAVGSNYVWVSGGETKEMYVVEIPGGDIYDATVVTTLSNVTSGQMIYVNNYERVRLAEMMTMSAQSAAQAQIKTTASTNNGGFDATTSRISIAALVISCVALLIGMALVALQFMTPGVQQDALTPSDTQTLGSKVVA